MQLHVSIPRCAFTMALAALLAACSPAAGPPEDDDAESSCEGGAPCADPGQEEATGEAALGLVQASIHVAPWGNDASSGTDAAPLRTIEAARNRVRSIKATQGMTGDIVVSLRGGTYSPQDTSVSPPRLATLTFDASDSGVNGYSVIYQSHPGERAVISGGKTITGWTLHDAAKNIWRAPVAAADDFRQLYVNARRATRARGESLADPIAIRDGAGKISAYSTSTSMTGWGNKTHIELVYNAWWAHSRLLVAGIVADGGRSKITLQEPAWTFAQQARRVDEDLSGQNSPAPENTYPTWIENAYELLDEAGEWYLDKTADLLYYKPLRGEDMSNPDSVRVIAPILERLVEVKGTLAAPVHHLQMKGLTFSHATQLRASAQGHIDAQANMIFDQSQSDPNLRASANRALHMPANVAVENARNVRLEDCTFTALGSNALDLVYTQDTEVVGSEIHDVSGSGIEVLGYVREPQPDDPAKISKNNSIRNNHIHHTGVEYAGGVGVFVGYTENTSVEHNELHDLPYSAISVGWGWGWTDRRLQGGVYVATPTPSKANKIRYNLIHDHMMVMEDGAGIYTLGDLDGTEIAYNVIRDQENKHGAIYFDMGSRRIDVHDNVLSRTRGYPVFDNSGCTNACPAATGIAVGGNTWDAAPSMGSGITVPVPNALVTNGRFPPAVVDAAGLEAAYRARLPEENLAYQKPVRALFMDGKTASTHPGHEAEDAVDGLTSTFAQASMQWLWQLEVDLQAERWIDHVRVLMDTDVYATQFRIDYKVDGATWSPAKTVSGHTGGLADVVFPAVRARYVRIVAIAPSGPNQPGGQMRIVELEVLAARDLALARPAQVYDMADEVATPIANHGPEEALDGDAKTFTQVWGHYAYKLEVDLGANHVIDQVRVHMGRDNFATRLQIFTRADDQGWSPIPIKDVRDNRLRIRDERFAPITARHVRVVAVTPNGSGQVGGQMAVHALEVRAADLARGRAATGLYLDGSPATMQAATPASKAVDTHEVTGAQAANQWAWQLLVDLGAAYPVGQVGVVMDQSLFATSYDVGTSTNGSTWQFTHVDSTVGGRRDVAVAPASARYVKVVALAPNAPNQPGTQMRINQLEVSSGPR